MGQPKDAFDWSVEETTDLRSGAELDLDLLALLPLVGVWRGGGHGISPVDGSAFTYLEQVRISHDGRPFLVHEGRTWLTRDDRDGPPQPGERESGYWHPGVGGDAVQLSLAASTGGAQTLIGEAGDARWELATDPHLTTGVTQQRRFYAVVSNASAAALVYAHEIAPSGGPLQPHLNGRLDRVWM